MDPRNRLALVMLYLIGASFKTSVPGLLLWSLTVLPFVPWRKKTTAQAALKTLAALVPSLAVFGLILGLSQGWNAGILACTRLGTLIVGPWVFFQRTTPEQLRNAFAWARLPPSFIFSFTTAVSFMEVLGTIVADLRLNLRLRGVSPRHLGALLLAAAVEVFRQADDLALSLETRGYSPQFARRVRGLRWRRQDTLLLAVSLGLTTASFWFPWR